ncbi:MAG: hypothetical protein MUE53_05180 [Chitinophagales bacterium]|jgi:hypothetical protein|nr:hypothetical protein [Chitinophagales bacterium]
MQNPNLKKAQIYLDKYFKEILSNPDKYKDIPHPLYAVEQILHKLKTKNKIDIKLNTSIPILTKRFKEKTSIPKVLYQYSILHYWAIKEINHDEIFPSFEEILKKSNHILTSKDMEFTKTGATRAYTNMRFAFNTLVNCGLINSRDYNAKRYFSISILGLIILIYNKYLARDDNHLKNDLIPLWEISDLIYFDQKKETEKGLNLDTSLDQLIYKLDQDKKFEVYLNHISNNTVTTEEFQEIKRLVSEFHQYKTQVLDNNLTQESKKSLGIDFRKKMTENSKNTDKFKKNLLIHYKQIPNSL